MTLRARIVAALVLAALIPAAVVLAVPLMQARERAAEVTAERLRRARTQAAVLIEQERAEAANAADRAAEALGSNHTALSSVVRGPEAVAQPVAQAWASRFVFDRVTIIGASGAVLASFGREAFGTGEAALTEERRVAAEGETLRLAATRILGAGFVEKVAAITAGTTHLGPAGSAECPEPRIELPVSGSTSLCVSVTPADARELRGDLLRSFASVAPVAFVAALAVGLILAGRIARPIRDLAERAEAIGAEHAKPMTLLPERDETRRMTLAFDQMLDSLEASERRRLAAERVAAWEEIAKRLAHEIKNPLSPIKLAVENLRKTRERHPEAFDQAFLVETQTILEEVASLRSLVDEFAQFARLPRPQVSNCDPRAIVEHAIGLFSARIAAMRVATSFDLAFAPSRLAADAEQIGRVLKNVIANALDAMEDSATRTLAISVTGEGDRLHFAVTDSGKGFDTESLRRVFEPYYTTRANRGGTGLGMAIARRIAIEHGGSLTATGSLGRGATITLTLPILGPPPEAA